MKRWVKFDGLGRRLVVSGLILALALGVLISMTTSSSSLTPGISAVGFTTHYGPPPPTHLRTKLHGDGRWEDDILVVSAGTAVTDTATLTGLDASAATGTVTYKVFFHSDCDSKAISGGTVDVTAGSVPDSNAVRLSKPDTYYWQASYSGDANNAPSKSSCGSEKVTVTKKKHHRR